MRKYFKGVQSKDDDGWMLGDCGNSSEDNHNDYVITTNSLHGDQVPSACNDAMRFSRLASGLLNCFYNNIETKGLTEDQLIEMGTVQENEQIPHPSNPKLF